MSQDLFAAFNALSDERATPPTNTTLTDHSVEDDDDFGDFEDASAPVPTISAPAVPTPTTTNPAQKPSAPPSLPFELKTKECDGPEVGSHPFAGRMDLLFDADDDEYDAGEDDLYDLSKNPEAAMEYSKRIIAQQSQTGHLPFSQASTNPSLPSEAQAGTPKVKDPNVLFDAEDVSEHGEEDDWGDFEGTASPPPPVKEASNAMDLLGLDDEAPKPTPKAQTQPIGHKIAKAHRSADLFKKETVDDAWDDFEESLPTSTPAPTDLATTPTPTFITTPSPAQPQRPRIEETTPPTNIPPPSHLLSLFPAVFSSAHSSLFDPLSKLVPNERQTLLTHPATHRFLHTYIDSAIVLGHIIAGRKARWKRDQFLAQSTRIGPAAAGGGKGGGMKLAGLDKSEATKEDREVLDVVRLWKGQVGRLRSAVSGAGMSRQVPEIADVIPVRVLKQTQGGYVAPHACALCGLKREERAAKVDVDVDDSFGEWWLEKMNMHVSCRTFWEEHKGRLKSR